MSRHVFMMLGRIALGLGFAGLGLAQARFGAELPDLQSLPLPLSIVYASALLLTLGGLALLWDKTAPIGAAGLTLFWAGFCALHTWTALVCPLVPSFVAPAELAVFAAASLVFAPGPIHHAGSLALRLILGATLALFGAVHVLFHDGIAEMIPAWMPGRDYWPYATAALNGLAGFAIFTGVWARRAALLTGVMFLSWLPLVHAPRLLADPGSLKEWTFALTALALAGAALTAGSRAGADA